MSKVTRPRGHDRMDCCPAVLAISMYLASEPILIMACFIDLKQTDCQSFLQQKWVYYRISEELHCGVCNHGEPRARPPWQGKMGKGSREGYSKRRVHAFHWLSCCQERKRVFLLSFGLCYLFRCESSSFWPPNSI